MTVIGLVDVEIPEMQRLGRDLRKASALMDANAARFLVDLYYRLQEHRIAVSHQARTQEENGAPTEILKHYANEIGVLEASVKPALKSYASSKAVGRWSMAQYGIGEVIAAGLLAHIDIAKAPTVGHIYSYAGVVPGQRWDKGQKRPWNADLKVLVFKIGHSFKMFHKKEECFYGQIYAAEKQRRVELNESGAYAERAAEILRTKNIKAAYTKGVLESGKLTDAHIDQQAQRFAAKMFLSHWHEVAYWNYYGAPPPQPYPIAHLNHAHKLACPDLAEYLPGAPNGDPRPVIEIK